MISKLFINVQDIEVNLGKNLMYTRKILKFIFSQLHEKRFQPCHSSRQGSYICICLGGSVVSMSDL